MKPPVAFKGRVEFYWNTEYKYFTAHQVKPSEPVGEALTNTFIYLGAFVDVDVKFVDVREKQIEQLEGLIEKERAESQFRITQLLGHIESLRALEHVPVDGGVA